MKQLLGLTLQELKEAVNKLELPGFTAGQIATWLYKKNIKTVDEMTNISLKSRELLKEKYIIGKSEPEKYSLSKDGTKKYLFSTSVKNDIEAVFLPEAYRNTLCISTQAGCKMSCSFCMTGKMGFGGNLSSGEIINQVLSIPEFPELSNLVYMGMGEPFDNLENVLKSLEIITSEWGLGWSPRRITVSTIGLVAPMKVFLEKSQCHLAVSLHTPFEEERQKMMPIEKSQPISKVIETIRNFDFGKQRRISFEYIMFKGINDTPAHIREITKLLNGIRCRINLIRFHKIPGSTFQPSEEHVIENFMVSLNNKGIRATIRASRGEDIEAACGQLSTKSKSHN